MKTVLKLVHFRQIRYLIWAEQDHYLLWYHTSLMVCFIVSNIVLIINVSNTFKLRILHFIPPYKDRDLKYIPLFDWVLFSFKGKLKKIYVHTLKEHTLLTTQVVNRAWNCKKNQRTVIHKTLITQKQKHIITMNINSCVFLRG